MGSTADEVAKARISTRDPVQLQQQLTGWFEQNLPAGSRPRLSSFRQPAKAGMSSETLLFDMSWHDAGVEHTGSFVARLPPPADACPLFPTYDFDLQVGALRLVQARSRVPVPSVRWYEPDPRAIGVPFFVMDRLEGEVVPDNPPYIFGGWLREAGDAELARLQGELLAVIAGVHGIEAAPEETKFLERRTQGTSALRRHFAHENAYYEWGREELRFPIIERLFDWLEEHWPADEGRAVVSWGDARPANVLWRDWRATAVLDWEEATLAPPELDVGYAIFFHQYFRSFCRSMTGMDAMAGFLRRDDVVAAYQKLTGTRLHDIDWYVSYGLLRQSLVEIRISRRRILFGEMEPPADVADYVYARPLIERLLAGDTDLWAN